MGLFSFLESMDNKLRSQSAPAKTSSNRSSTRSPSAADTKKADEQIAKLQKASEKYKKDNDLSACIATYESILDLSKPRLWNNFNFCLTLADMYIKADRKNDAWRFLNQMSVQAVRDSTAPDYEISKIRYKQFGILKKEKKHLDALQMLSTYHVLKTNTENNGSVFDCDKFIKDANTTAKSAGLSPQQLESLADSISKMAKSKRGKATENDVIKAYREYIKSQGLA